MFNNKKILAIIPARGGSKTVPCKNIKELNNKPLIAYSIDQAKKSEYVDRVIISTDDNEIAEVSRKYGAEVQMRPAELAEDTTPTLPVLQYAVKELEKEGFKADIIVLLQPTSPFRKPGEIDRAIEEFAKSDIASSMMSVSQVPDHFSPYWVKRIENNQLLPGIGGDKINDDKKYTRKQDLPKLYWKNGAIYIMSYDTLITNNSIFGNICIPFLSEIEELANIDTQYDFALAEFLISHFKEDI